MGFNTDYIAQYTIGDNGIVGVINHYLVPVIFTISLLVFLWGVAKAYILSGGEERAEGHKLILWGVVGFAAMLSVWGLVNLAQSIIGVPDTSAPPTPQIELQ